MILLGHALTKHRTYRFQKLIPIRGRSAKEYVRFLEINSPTNFSVYVIVCGTFRYNVAIWGFFRVKQQKQLVL